MEKGSMTKNQQILTKLNTLWCKCIIGHHKSCDPVHYIYQEYTFGDLVYKVEHGAYIGEEINGTFSTLEAAENFLIREIAKEIEKQSEWNLDAIARGDIEELSYLDEPKPEYWQGIRADLKEALKSQEPTQENWEERALEAERKYNYLKNALDYAIEQLDRLGVSKYDKEYPEMPYSIGHRITILGTGGNAKMIK
jgi:hypothetical protein